MGFDDASGDFGPFSRSADVIIGDKAPAALLYCLRLNVGLLGDVGDVASIAILSLFILGGEVRGGSGPSVCRSRVGDVEIGCRRGIG